MRRLEASAQGARMDEQTKGSLQNTHSHKWRENRQASCLGSQACVCQHLPLSSRFCADVPCRWIAWKAARGRPWSLVVSRRDRIPRENGKKFEPTRQTDEMLLIFFTTNFIPCNDNTLFGQSPSQADPAGTWCSSVSHGRHRHNSWHSERTLLVFGWEKPCEEGETKQIQNHFVSLTNLRIHRFSSFTALFCRTSCR